MVRHFGAVFDSALALWQGAPTFERCSANPGLELLRSRSHEVYEMQLLGQASGQGLRIDTNGEARMGYQAHLPKMRGTLL